MEPDTAYELLHTALMLDGRPTLNLASFVTTWMEPQAEALIHETLHKNHIDHEEYPAASLVEEACVHMLGRCSTHPTRPRSWAWPPSARPRRSCSDSSPTSGLGATAGRQPGRHRPAQRRVRGRDARGLGQVRALLRRRDAQGPDAPRSFRAHPDDVEPQIDENTIAVGAVLGTTFIGEADPIAELNDLLVRIKHEKGWDIPLHVDGASGGFIAPFAHPDLLWDFRLEQVGSINASGHKYGLVYPGVGWLVFRDRFKLPEDLVFNVNYLGGAQPTYTFNFSRGTAMMQAQMYYFLRLGRTGYKPRSSGT